MKNIFSGFFVLVLMAGLVASSLGEAEVAHLNKVVAKLEKGKLVTGIWVQGLDLSMAVGIVEFNGYPTVEQSLDFPMIDFLLVEMEHEPFDVASLRTFLLGLNSKREVWVKGNLQPSLATFVRIPGEGHEPLHAMIKQVLDVGVHGVVIPHVQTAEEAEKIVRACRYVQPKNSPYERPIGTRGASPWLAAYLWGLSLSEYVDRADVWPLNPRGDLMVILMIEDVKAVENIDAILRVPGIGAVIFGPYDYSFSAGYYGKSDSPAVAQALGKVKRACDRANVSLVGFASPDNIEKLLDEKYRMLLIGTNVDLSGGPGKVLNFLRQKYR